MAVRRFTEIIYDDGTAPEPRAQRYAAPPRSAALAYKIGPVLDGMPGLTHGLGKGVLLVVEAPLAVVVHFDQMTERAARAEKLPFGVLALDFGGESLGHRHSLTKNRKNWIKPAASWRDFTFKIGR